MDRVFFEIFENMPRQGPGDALSTRKAFEMLTDLPSLPKIADIGCGNGAQTLTLASLTDGKITAVDNYEPFLEMICQKALKQSIQDRIITLNADMAKLPFGKGEFDLIWSEGAIYTIGFENGIRLWMPFIKDGGYLVASELSWLREDIPNEIIDYWLSECPTLDSVENNCNKIVNAGYRLVGHFTLPESSWLDEFYIPQEAILTQMRQKYADNLKALETIESVQKEIDIYRIYSRYYGYEFYIMQA